MEQTDRELLLSLTETHPRLKELYKQHIKLEKEVQKYERFVNYSATVAMRQKQLKKEKLRGMDNIMAILDGYRHAGESKLAS